MFSFKFSKSLPVVLLICGNAVADEPKSTLLDDVARRQEVAAQAFELDIDTLLTQAAKAEPVNAAELLEKALERIESEATLSPRRRSSLTKLVENRLRQSQTDQLVQKAKPRSEKPVRPANRAGDDDAVRQGLATIRALRQAGKMKEAERVASELARKYPTHPIVHQVRRSSTTTGGLYDTARIYEDKADRTAAALRDVDQSASSIRGDIEYSPKFPALSAARKDKYAFGRVNLTKKEKEIISALNAKTSAPIEFKNLSFDTVIELLQKEIGQPLFVNKIAVDEQKIDYEVPISASIPAGTDKRTMLIRILNDLGLTYVIKNQSIEVTSVLGAEDEMVVRYYQVDDFLPLGGLTVSGFDQRTINPNLPGPAIPPTKAGGMTVDDLITMIKRSIAPNSWEPNGPGKITYFAPTRTLIIRNSAEVINQFGATPAGK